MNECIYECMNFMQEIYLKKNILTVTNGTGILQDIRRRGLVCNVSAY